MAGTPLKASMDALLVALNSINVSQHILEYLPCVIDHSGRQGSQNRENAAHLIQRLEELKEGISALPTTPSARDHEFARYVSPSEM
jgi:hypothetical protein